MAEPNRPKPSVQLHQPAAYQTWSTTPPDEMPIVKLKIIRCAIGKPQSWILLSNDWRGCATHFFQGRTRKCKPEGCDACAAGHQARWHGFVAVFNPISHMIAILEVPKDTVHQVNHHRNALTSFRGQTITIERVPNRINGTVHATLKPSQVDVTNLPRDPDVKSILENMWDRAEHKMTLEQRSL